MRQGSLETEAPTKREYSASEAQPYEEEAGSYGKIKKK